MENTEEKLYTAVVYTDGSAGPKNPGFIGSGAHGFIYSDEDINAPVKDAPNGGYVMTTKGYMLAEFAKKLDKVMPVYYIDAMFIYNEIGTNNVAEVRAITNSIKELLNSNLTFKKFIFKSDSAYALHIIRELMHGNDDDHSNKPNSDLWFLLRDQIEELRKLNISLETIKVLGHSDNLGNNITDMLAVNARYNAEEERHGMYFNIIPNNKYWKPNIKKEPFLNVKSLFFTHSDRDKNPFRYVIMDYSKENEIGTNDRSALFGLLFTKGQFTEIEEILDLDKKIVKGNYALSELNMKTFYSPDYYNYKDSFGELAFLPNRKQNGINLLSYPLTNTSFQGLAKVAFNRTIDLETTYKNYTKFFAGESLDNSEFIDITDMIYSKNEKGKQTCHLDQKLKHLEYIYKYNDKKNIKIFLTLGTELPTRNILKNLEKDVEKVYLEVVKKDSIIQTNIIIVTEDVTAIYTNFFTRNLIV